MDFKVQNSIIARGVTMDADMMAIYDAAFYNAGNAHYREAMQLLWQCDSVCRSKGVIMNVVVLPYRSQLVGKNVQNDLPQTLVGNFCKKNGIAAPKIGVFSSIIVLRVPNLYQPRLRLHSKRMLLPSYLTNA